MITDWDAYESYIEDHMIAFNKYKCTIYGCENILTQPEWIEGEGVCRSHRGNSGLKQLGFSRYKKSPSNPSKESSVVV